MKKPERVEAVLMLMTLCLLIYAALELRMRQALKERGETIPYSNKKQIQNPTMKWAFCYSEAYIGSVSMTKNKAFYST